MAFPTENTQMSGVSETTGYFPGIRGHLYGVLSRPANGVTGVRSATSDIVYLIPPLFEEYNCSKRFMTCVRREFTRIGWSAVQYDLFGTGDSQGTLDQACWDDWQADLCSTVAALRAQGFKRIHVLSLRAGNLLYTGSAADLSYALSSVLMLDPVVDGAVYLEELSRLHVASHLLSPTPGGSLKVLRQKLRDGVEVELGGYVLNSSLLQALQGQRPDTCDVIPTTPQCAVKMTDETCTGRDSDGTGKCTQRDPETSSSIDIPGARVWQKHGTAFRHSTIRALVALQVNLAGAICHE